MNPYEVPAADADLLHAGVRIDPEDHERFPLPPHKHSASRPFPDCRACDEHVAAVAERRRIAKEAAEARAELAARLARERDEHFRKSREAYAKLQQLRRNAPMPPAMPQPHPLSPLPCQVCGRFPAQHTLMANGALVCWTPPP